MLRFGQRCVSGPSAVPWGRTYGTVTKWGHTAGSTAPTRRRLDEDRRTKQVNRRRMPVRDLPQRHRDRKAIGPLPTKRDSRPARAEPTPAPAAVKTPREATGWRLPSLKEHKLGFLDVEERKRQAANYKFRQNPAMKLRDLALQGKADEALAMFEKTPKEELRRDAFVFNHLLLACARAGKWNKSFKVYNRLKKHAVEPDMKSFSMMVNCLANVVHEPSVTKEQRIEWTRKKLDYVAEELHRRGVTPSAQLYNVVFKTLAAVGDVNGALSLMREMDLGGGSLSTSSQTESLQESEKTESSMVTENKTAVKEKSDKEEERKPRADLMTFTTLVKLFGARSVDQAFVIWDKMRSAGRVKPDTRFFNALAASCIKHRKAEVCLEVLDEMATTYKLRPDTVSLTHMAAAFAAMGRPAYAPVVLKRAEEHGIDPDPFLLSALLRLGTQKSWEVKNPIEGCDIKSAEEFVQVMEKKLARADGSVKDAHAHMFLVGCTHSAMPSRAVYYYQLLTDRNQPIEETLYQKLASACKKHGSQSDQDKLLAAYEAQRLVAARRAGRGPPREEKE